MILQHFTNKKVQLGVGGLLLGILCHLLGYVLFTIVIRLLEYLFLLAALVILYRYRKEVGKSIKGLFLAGVACVGGSLLLNLLMWVSGYVFMPYPVLMLLYLAGTGLIVFDQIKAGQKVGVPMDVKSVKNIRKNGNKGLAVQNGLVILVGLILFFMGIRDSFALYTVLGLAVMGYGGFQLWRALTQPDLREDELYAEQDDELSGEIKKLQAILRIVRILMLVTRGIAFVAAFSVLFTENFVPVLVAAIPFTIVECVKSNYEHKLKKYVADNIVRQALEDVFEIEEYKPFGCIDVEKIKGADFGVGWFDKTHGSDYVRGTYKGLPIEMCDIRLTYVSVDTDEHGFREETDVEVFHGFWLTCDFVKELSAALRLWERDRLKKLTGGEGIQTENDRFNKHFQIESEVEVEAFYILTPHMMEYILEMDKKAKGQTHMRFDRDGKVQIAINTGRDGFEVGKRVKNATLLRKQFVAEIRQITDMIDELRLVDTLFRK